MGWASKHIAALLDGRTATFRPEGHSMTGRVNHLDLVEVSPLMRDPVKGDVVLCTVAGGQKLHLVSAVRNGMFEISNNHGRKNGWVSKDGIHGILTAVNPAG